MEPGRLPFPNFTSPPAGKAFVEVGKFGVRLLVTSIVDGEDSLPVVSVEKSSLSTIGTTTKSVALVPVPNELVTEIFPFVAAPGTMAVILVNESTVYVVLAEPLKLTAVTPEKLLPVIVTEAPTAPLAGENELIDGEPSPLNTENSTCDDVVTAPSLSVARAVNR
jgi:hypothetical protein